MLSLLEMSVTGGVLIAAVVIIRALTVHRLPKAGLLAFWAAALCRLLLPLRLPSPTSLYAHTPALELAAGRPGILLAGTALAEAEGAAGPALPVWLPIWGAAALGLALFFTAAHLRGLRRYGASLPEETPFVQRWLAANPLRRRVAVRCSDQIDAPLTYGLLRPVILLPKGLDRTDEERLSFVLAHEFAHIRRCDVLFKGLLALALCLHWFNPLVWAMYLLAGRDLELACDESVVRRYGRGARAAYALALVELEEKRLRFTPLHSSFAKNALEERITAIMKNKTITAAGIIGAAAVAVVLVAVFATSAPAEQSGGGTAVRQWIGTSYGAPLAEVDRTLGSGGQIQTAVVTEDSLWDGTGEPLYTKKQYDLAVRSLKFDGWESMSIAQFNRSVNAAFSAEDSWEEDGLALAYEYLLMSLPADDENAGFLLNTVQASRNEYQSRLDEVYSNKQVDPSFSGSASRWEEKDVFGEKVRTAYAGASYTFTYRILDQDNLTVAERDQFLQQVMQGAQDYLDGLTMGQIIDDKDGQASFQTALEAAGRGASTGEISFTGCTVQDFGGYYHGEGF